MGKIVRALSADGSALCSAVDTTDIVNEIHRIHGTSATASAAAGRLATAACIMGALMKNETDRLELRINGGGKIGTITTVADYRGNVKCCMDNPFADLPLNSKGKLDVGGIVGTDGYLSVIRDLGMKEPYVGQVPIVSGEIAIDVTQYYAVSEQIPTVCALGVLVDTDLTIKKAGGYMIQLVPPVNEAAIDFIEENIKDMQSVTKMLEDGLSPEEIALKGLKGLDGEILDSWEAQYYCDCSRERTEQVLITLGKDELAKLAEEDPTFRTYTNEETGQTVIAGMGELHLEIIVDRLLREFKVEANVGAPQVAYKETITTNADVDTKYARQSGGKGQYGHVKLHVYPNESGKGYEFINAIVGGSIPKEYIPAVDAGIQGALQSGVLAGYPTVDVKVELYDGSYHEVDSSEMAFKIAGSMAIKEACRKANPVILEPIMKVVVTVPEEYMGDVIGDLSSRRGEIQGMEDRNGVKQINAFVPLSEMFRYSNDLRSKTQGRGQYVMEPSHYIQVPKTIADGIISKRAKG